MFRNGVTFKIFALLLVASLSSCAHKLFAPRAKLVLLGQMVIEHDPRKHFTKPVAEFLPHFSDADLVFTNLESTIKGVNDILVPTRTGLFHHSAGPEVLDFLLSIKINALALANNHIWDNGANGILATLRELNLRKFSFVGAGINNTQAQAPLVKEINGIKIAILAFATIRTNPLARAQALSPGINLLDLESEEDFKKSILTISEAKKQYDIVLIYHHFQTVGTMEWQRKFAKAAIDAGGDIYVSHGEPRMEGIEIYKSRPLFYNLGNFIFQTKTPLGHYGIDTWRSIITTVTIENNVPKMISFIPIRLNEGERGENFFEKRGFPSLASSSESKEILMNLQNKSRGFGTQILSDGVKGSLLSL